MQAVEAIFKAILLLMILIEFIIGIVMVTLLVFIIGAILLAASGGNGSIGFVYVESILGSSTIRVEEQIVWIMINFLEFEVPFVKLLIKINGVLLLSFTFSSFGKGSDFPEIPEIPEEISEEDSDSGAGIESDIQIITSNSYTMNSRSLNPKLTDGAIDKNTGFPNEKLNFIVGYDDIEGTYDSVTHTADLHKVNVIIQGDDFIETIPMTSWRYIETRDGRDWFEFFGTLDAGSLNLETGDYTFSFEIRDKNTNTQLDTHTSTFNSFKIEFDWGSFQAFYESTMWICGVAPALLITFANNVKGLWQWIFVIAAIVIPLIYIGIMLSILEANRGQLAGLADPTGIALGISIAMIITGFAMLLLFLSSGGAVDSAKELAIAIGFGILGLIGLIIGTYSLDFAIQIFSKILGSPVRFLGPYTIIGGIYQWGLYHKKSTGTGTGAFVGLDQFVGSFSRVDYAIGLFLFFYPIFLIVFGFILALSCFNY